MWPNPHLVTFIKETLNGKLHVFYSVYVFFGGVLVQCCQYILFSFSFFPFLSKMEFIFLKDFAK